VSDVLQLQGYKQRNAFIVTQAPLVNTVVDFWTLVHDHSCRAIVMMNEQDPADKVEMHCIASVFML
jgi:protein tyrosine phosphatase